MQTRANQIEYLLQFANANSSTQQRNTLLLSVNANSRKSNTKIEYLPLRTGAPKKETLLSSINANPCKSTTHVKSLYLARFDMLCPPCMAQGVALGCYQPQVHGSRFAVRRATLPADLIMFWLHLSLFHYILPYRLVISRLPCLATTFLVSPSSDVSSLPHSCHVTPQYLILLLLHHLILFCLALSALDFISSHITFSLITRQIQLRKFRSSFVRIYTLDSMLCSG
jgi:hypothetical protein